VELRDDEAFLAQMDRAGARAGQDRSHPAGYSGTALGGC
jgi:hypothetical protein